MFFHPLNKFRKKKIVLTSILATLVKFASVASTKEIDLKLIVLKTESNRWRIKIAMTRKKKTKVKGKCDD